MTRSIRTKTFVATALVLVCAAFAAPGSASAASVEVGRRENVCTYAKKRVSLTDWVVLGKTCVNVYAYRTNIGSKPYIYTKTVATDASRGYASAYAGVVGVNGARACNYEWMLQKLTCQSALVEWTGSQASIFGSAIGMFQTGDAANPEQHVIAQVKFSVYR